MSDPTRLSIRVLIGAFLLSSWALPVHADDQRPARVSDVLGMLYARSEDEDEISNLDRNSVVREGDALWTDQDGRAELELEQGCRIRLAESTKLEIRTLNGSSEFRLWTGSVYVDLSDRRDRPYLVDTPEGEIQIEPNSVVRVDLGRDSDTRISVWNGAARITPETGDPSQLRSSERIYLEAGRIVQGPERFSRGDRDAFDQYHTERVDYYLSRPQPRELEQDLPGSRELQDQGAWVIVDQVHYWRPYHEVNWRPYSHGYWSVVPGWGYTWVDYSPWGYVTSHYGRWLYRPTQGWLWYPGYIWSPAAVSWAVWGDYFGWAPLDPWDRPCFVGLNSVLILGLDIDFQCWTFCRRNRFFHSRHHWRLEDGHRHLHGWKEVRHRREEFHPVRKVYDEIGVPSHTARGLTIGRDGRIARERVLELENAIPNSRLLTIQRRFQAAPDRDRLRAQRSGDVERLQRAPWLDLVPQQVLTHREAEQRLRRTPAVRIPGFGAETPGTRRGPSRDDAFRRTQPLLPRPGGSPLPRQSVPSFPRASPVRPGREPGSSALPRTPSPRIPPQGGPVPNPTRVRQPMGSSPTGRVAPSGTRTAPPAMRTRPSGTLPDSRPGSLFRPPAPTVRPNTRNPRRS